MTLFRDDPALLRRFREGDRAALGAAYDAYVMFVASIISRGVLLGDVNLRPPPREERDDLIHDVFVRAFSERARIAYDGLREYRPYLAQICRNVVIDWARKRGRNIDPEALALHLERDEEVELSPVVVAYVASLAPALKALYEARYVQCLSQEEAGRTLGLSRQQLRTQEKKLRDGLATKLAKGA